MAICYLHMPKAYFTDTDGIDFIRPQTDFTNRRAIYFTFFSYAYTHKKKIQPSKRTAEKWT